jgi:hypothetical protein
MRGIFTVKDYLVVYTKTTFFALPWEDLSNLGTRRRFRWHQLKLSSAFGGTSTDSSSSSFITGSVAAACSESGMSSRIIYLITSAGVFYRGVLRSKPVLEKGRDGKTYPVVDPAAVPDLGLTLLKSEVRQATLQPFPSMKCEVIALICLNLTYSPLPQPGTENGFQVADHKRILAITKHAEGANRLREFRIIMDHALAVYWGYHDLTRFNLKRKNQQGKEEVLHIANPTIIANAKEDDWTVSFIYLDRIGVIRFGANTSSLDLYIPAARNITSIPRATANCGGESDGRYVHDDITTSANVTTKLACMTLVGSSLILVDNHRIRICCSIYTLFEIIQLIVPYITVFQLWSTSSRPHKDMLVEERRGSTIQKAMEVVSTLAKAVHTWFLENRRHAGLPTKDIAEILEEESDAEDDISQRLDESLSDDDLVENGPTTEDEGDDDASSAHPNSTTVGSQTRSLTVRHNERNVHPSASARVLAVNRPADKKQPKQIHSDGSYGTVTSQFAQGLQRTFRGLTYLLNSCPTFPVHQLSTLRLENLFGTMRQNTHSTMYPTALEYVEHYSSSIAEYLKKTYGTSFRLKTQQRSRRYGQVTDGTHLRYGDVCLQLSRKKRCKSFLLRKEKSAELNDSDQEGAAIDDGNHHDFENQDDDSVGDSADIEEELTRRLDQALRDRKSQFRDALHDYLRIFGKPVKAKRIRAFSAHASNVLPYSVSERHHDGGMKAIKAGSLAAAYTSQQQTDLTTAPMPSQEDTAQLQRRGRPSSVTTSFVDPGTSSTDVNTNSKPSTQRKPRGPNLHYLPTQVIYRRHSIVEDKNGKLYLLENAVSRNRDTEQLKPDVVVCYSLEPVCSLPSASSLPRWRLTSCLSPIHTKNIYRLRSDLHLKANGTYEQEHNEDLINLENETESSLQRKVADNDDENDKRDDDGNKGDDHGNIYDRNNIDDDNNDDYDSKDEDSDGEVADAEDVYSCNDDEDFNDDDDEY